MQSILIKTFNRRYKHLENKFLLRVWILINSPYLCRPKVLKTHAEVAQLVEHHLAKVRVAGSSLVFRSNKNSIPPGWNFLFVTFFVTPWWRNW